MQVPALIVEPQLPDLRLYASILSALGFDVTTTETFEEARHSLRVPPTLLIADIRLGEFNGLHLVLRGKSAHPDMAAIVVSDVDDPVLQAEAESMGATFIHKPVEPEEIEAAVCRTVLRDRGAAFVPIRAPFERRRSDRRVSPLSMSELERRRSDRRASARARIQQLATH
jgi:DNA-binding response OmpR family regulator